MKPEKCSAYLSSYCITITTPLRNLSEPKAWVDVKHNADSRKLQYLDPSHMSVLQLDGSPTHIAMKDVTKATGMLVRLCIEAMKAKGTKRADRQITRPLPARDTWLSLFLQLYPGMMYDLASSVIKPDKLGLLMNGLHYKILPLLGLTYA